MSKKQSSLSKKTDSLIGIPLLFALSGLGGRKQGKLPPNISRVAFIRIDSPRDTVMTLSAVRGVKERYPKAETVFFAGKDNYEAACLIPCVDEVIQLDAGNIGKSIKIIKSSGMFEIWIDFGIRTRFESLMTFFAKAHYKVGFRTSGEYRHFSYDAVADIYEKKPLYDSYGDLIKLVGAAVSLKTYTSLDNAKDDKLVVLNMYPDKSEYKRRAWNEENWKYIISRLSKKGYRLAITGSKLFINEADAFIESLGTECDVEYFVGRIEGKEYIPFLSKASLVISVDSWILHIASAVDTPVVGIYGPTSPSMYPPMGRKARCLACSHSCLGCQNINDEARCIEAERNCIDEIDPSFVEKEALDLLEGRHEYYGKI